MRVLLAVLALLGAVAGIPLNNIRAVNDAEMRALDNRARTSFVGGRTVETCARRPAGYGTASFKRVGDPMKTFQQTIDHTTSGSGTFAQRYTVNETYSSGAGSPIFLFLGGEAPLEFFDFQEILIYTTARRFGARVYKIEHRFYGESMPSELTTANLDQLLSADQALADAAAFLDAINTDGSPVIVWGCSYSGALSSWMRQKYPDKVAGSVAPSGPVLAKSDFYEFFGQFSSSAPPACVEAAHTASTQIQQMAETAEGLASLSTTFNACETVTDADKYYFLWSLVGQVGSSDQMNNPGNWILNGTCSHLTASGDPVANFAAAFEYLNEHSDLAVRRTPVKGPVAAGSCNDFSEAAMIKSLQPTGTSENAGGSRSWWHQKCKEFGYFKSATVGTSPFFTNLPVDHIVGYCAQIFGTPGMKPDIDGTNAKYGGMQPSVTNVIYTYGQLDPWSILGITEDLGNTVKSSLYEAGHCAPMIEPLPEQDPPSLVTARYAVADFILSTLNSINKED